MKKKVKNSFNTTNILFYKVPTLFKNNWESSSYIPHYFSFIWYHQDSPSYREIFLQASILVRWRRWVFMENYLSVYRISFVMFLVNRQFLLYDFPFSKLPMPHFMRSQIVLLIQMTSAAPPFFFCCVQQSCGVETPLYEFRLTYG